MVELLTNFMENPAVLMKSARLLNKRGDSMIVDNFLQVVMHVLRSQVAANIETLGDRNQLIGR